MLTDKYGIRLLLVSFVVLLLAIINTSCSESMSPSYTYVPTPKPVQPASLSVTNIVITPLIAQPTDAVTITAEITNTGGTSGSYLAVLRLNDVPKAQTQISVSAQGKQYVSWQIKGGLGNLLVSVGEVSASYTVLPASTPALSQYDTLPPAQFSTSQPSYYDLLRQQQEYRAWQSQEQLNKMQMEELRRQEQERLQQQKLLEQERTYQQIKDEILKGTDPANWMDKYLK